MFKVVPDQLRMSDGWVRCGRCGEVFDATAQLQPLVAVAPPPNEMAARDAGATVLSELSIAAPPVDESAVTEAAAPAMVASPQAVTPRDEPAQVPATEPPAQEDAVPSLALLPSEVVPVEETRSLSSDPTHAPSQDLVMPEAEAEAEGASGLAEALPATPESEVLAPREPTLMALTLNEPTRIEPVLEASAESAPVSGPAHEAVPPEVASESAPEVPEVSFVRQARRKAFWRRPWVRALLTLVVLALTLALALQVTVQQRDRLAALQPRLMPWLQALCEPLQCRLAPLRQIESVMIDNSAFTKVNGEVFRLGVALRNQATIPVAMPSLELSLTDSQDQPVVRRVLHPADLGAPPVLPAAGEWSVTTNLTLEAEGQAERIAGYRLIAFYP